MNYRKSLGARGENLVKEHLLKTGQTFIAQNYRCGRQEIDLIFKDGAWLVFIEVKTRQKTGAVETEGTLKPRQAQQLGRALTTYCLKVGHAPEYARLDLVIVSVDKKKVTADLVFYKNVL